MASRLPRVVFQPRWSVLGSEQRPGGPGRRLEGHGVTAGSGGEASAVGRYPSFPQPQHRAPSAKHLTFVKPFHAQSTSRGCRCEKREAR